MFKFKDVSLQLNLTVANSLKKIYGIGLQKSSYLFSMFGFSENVYIGILNHYFFECISILIKNNYVVEDRMIFLIKSRFSKLVDGNNVKGKRYFSGLPIHGQRTHTNGKTSRRNIIK